MGKIIRNGIEYSGTSDSANNVNYDNSVSGLNARTVQEGIDELNKGNLGAFPVDNLLSTATDIPLSANQGRVLDEKISTINESLGVESISLNDVCQYVKGLTITKSGNICIVRISGIKQNLTTGTTYKICDLPEEYRPAFSCLNIIHFNAFDSTVLGYIYINPEDISIRVLKNVGKDTTFYAQEVYLCGNVNN